MWKGYVFGNGFRKDRRVTQVRTRICDVERGLRGNIGVADSSPGFA
jgi:hypothetical protein